MIIIDLVNHIKTNVNSNFYPLLMPQDAVKPSLVYTVVNNRDNQGVDGCVSSSLVSFQIDIYSTSYLEVKEQLELLKTSLYDFSAYPLNLNSRDNFEEDTGLYRQIVSFDMREK